jgi:hypothetical protein
MLFHMKSDWEWNTKKVEDLPTFPTGIYLLSSNQWFRSWSLEVDSVAEFLLWTALSDLRILQLWRHFEMATPKSLNTKFIDNPIIFWINLVTPWSSTQNNDYGHHKTADRHIAIGGRWKFHVHATDQHHLVRGAIMQIRWALHHATKITW